MTILFEILISLLLFLLLLIVIVYLSRLRKELGELRKDIINHSKASNTELMSTLQDITKKLIISNKSTNKSQTLIQKMLQIRQKLKEKKENDKQIRWSDFWTEIRFSLERQ